MSWIQKRGPHRYRVRYRRPDNTEASKTFSRRVDAERFASTVEADKARGEWVDPRLGRVTFGEWVGRWEAARLDRRASTMARDESMIRNHLMPTFGTQQLAKIQPAAVRAWIADLNAAGYAATTVRKANQLFANALEAAVADGMIQRSPARGVALPKVEHSEMRFLGVEEINQLVAASEPRHRGLILTAAYTGLRAGELAALHLDRLDMLRRSLLVTETLSEVRGAITVGPPKSNASRRTVSLPSFLVDELAAHLTNYPTNGRIFSSPDGSPIRWTNFRRRHWKPAVAASVGEPMRFHDLRHSHAALLIAAGEHPKVIQQRLGHASISTTLDTYGHQFDGLDEAAADRLDQAFSTSLAASTRPEHALGPVA